MARTSKRTFTPGKVYLIKGEPTRGNILKVCRASRERQKQTNLDAWHETIKAAHGQTYHDTRKRYILK